jgi:hypothetical protein
VSSLTHTFTPLGSTARTAPRLRAQLVKRNFVTRIVIAHRRIVVIGGRGYVPEKKKLKMTKKETDKRQFCPPLRFIDGSVTRGTMRCDHCMPTCATKSTDKIVKNRKIW